MMNCFAHSISVLVLGAALSAFGADEFSTSPVTTAELEARYTEAIEERAANILDALDLEDSQKIAEVRDTIINQYRALRARDAVVDDYLRAQGKEDSSTEREELAARLTEPLHELYVGTLSALLTPEQVELVKDRMTYDKVQVTFAAYCDIIGNLTDSEKAMILKVLKEAREEAINAGSAPDKHQVFERYKERINAQLESNGHDVDKAFSDWEAKQQTADTSSTN
jgi:hypothetical protein